MSSRNFQEHPSGWLEPVSGPNRVVVLERQGQSSSAGDALVAALSEHFSVRTVGRGSAQVLVHEKDREIAKIRVAAALDEIDSNWGEHLTLAGAD